MWSQQQQQRNCRFVIRNYKYRLINLALGACFIVYLSLASFHIINTLEKQRPLVISGVEKVFQNSIDYNRRLGVGGGIDYYKDAAKNESSSSGSPGVRRQVNDERLNVLHSMMTHSPKQQLQKNVRSASPSSSLSTKKMMALSSMSLSLPLPLPLSHDSSDHGTEQINKLMGLRRKKKKENPEVGGTDTTDIGDNDDSDKDNKDDEHKPSSSELIGVMMSPSPKQSKKKLILPPDSKVAMAMSSAVSISEQMSAAEKGIAQQINNFNIPNTGEEDSDKKLEENVGGAANVHYFNTPSTGEDKNDNKLEENITETSTSFNHRYIIFRKLGYGQGAGNVMNGLLAAHLFGQEFNRTVCVEEEYKEFHAVFETINPNVIQYCPDILHDAHVKEAQQLQLVNFISTPVDECSLQEQLASPTTSVLEYQGNTYPRWPHVQDSNFFFRHYKARQALLDILPFDYRHESPPNTVVHLRAPDPTGSDQRQGLDEESLVALGAELPRNATFLVTNKVDWFKRFEENYGWSHSNWNSVVHSAFNSMTWGDRHDLAAAPIDKNLQTWADWYIMLRAKKVYHTNSDFSNSAVHWMNIDSFVIKGYNQTSQSLILIRESWLIDGETPPLSNRTTAQEGESTRQLRGCPLERYK